MDSNERNRVKQYVEDAFIALQRAEITLPKNRGAQSTVLDFDQGLRVTKDIAPVIGQKLRERDADQDVLPTLREPQIAEQQFQWKEFLLDSGLIKRLLLLVRSAWLKVPLAKNLT